ncbi:hypothetical protein AB0M22_14015 [Nocardia sp. NPDC051756]|uniref:hypothetical protein n=1 Tax=Nocardia sp. NPDC051756 TaxID=3154751 RepID=UPI003416D261
MRWIARTLICLAACATGSVPVAAAQADAAMIDCGDSAKAGARLDITCHNPTAEAGTVSVTWVCSTPLDFTRRIVFTEPDHTIAAGSALRFTRDCGPDQVVLTYQAWPVTVAQQQDQNTRLDRIRDKRDREMGRN